MAFPTSVNDQITDSVTQANVTVQGDAPAMALGNLMIVTSQALANAAHNATATQQQMNIVAQAATAMSVTTILSVASGAAVDTTKLFDTIQNLSPQVKTPAASV